MPLVAQALEDGHRVRVPIFNETCHDFDSELGEPVDPAFSAVVRPKNRAHDAAVDLRHKEDGTRARNLLRDPFPLVPSIRPKRKSHLLPQGDERIVILASHLPDCEHRSDPFLTKISKGNPGRL